MKASLKASFDRFGAVAVVNRGIDPDDIVRLAGGEHLGSRHDAALEALAASPEARDAWRLARAIDADARALAQRIAAWRGENVVAFKRNAPRSPQSIRWAAAAVIAVVAVGSAWFGWQGLRQEPSAPIAATAPEMKPDLIFRSSDDGLVATAPQQSLKDEVFGDAFGG